MVASTGAHRSGTGRACSLCTRSAVPMARRSTSTTGCASSHTTTTLASTRCPGDRRTRHSGPCTRSGRPSGRALGTARHCPAGGTASTRTPTTATGSTDASGTSRTRSTASTSSTAPKRSSTMKPPVPATTPNSVSPNVSQTNGSLITAGARAILVRALRAGHKPVLVPAMVSGETLTKISSRVSKAAAVGPKCRAKSQLITVTSRISRRGRGVVKQETKRRLNAPGKVSLGTRMIATSSTGASLTALIHMWCTSSAVENR